MSKRYKAPREADTTVFIVYIYDEPGGVPAQKLHFPTRTAAQACLDAAGPRHMRELFSVTHSTDAKGRPTRTCLCVQRDGIVDAAVFCPSSTQ